MNVSWKSLYEETCREVCRQSFKEFVKEFWSEIIPEPLIWGWHMELICDELQVVAERVFKNQPKEYDLVVNVPPGSSKSSLCSVMFPAWVWTRMSSARFICSSYSHALSLALSIRCRDLLKSPKFLRFYKHVVIRADQDQKTYFKNIHGGERFCTSTTGSVTGMHGHFLICDDPVNPQESFSSALIKQANDWLDQTFLTRKVDKEITPFILIMQRLSQVDCTAHTIEKGTKIRHICLPAILTDDVRPVEVRKNYVNNLLDPVRMSEKALNDIRLDIGEYGYSGQFLQNPVPLGSGMFRVENIEIVPVPPSKIVSTIRYWDKAGTQGSGCFTVGLKMAKMKNGKFVVLDIVRGQWESDKREKIIKQTAQIDGIECKVMIEQEPGSGGKESAQATIRNLAGFSVIADLPKGDKILRADPYSVQVNSGNVYLIKKDWNREYIQELASFPVGKFRDTVDASSGALQALVGKKRVGVWSSS